MMRSMDLVFKALNHMVLIRNHEISVKTEKSAN